MLQAVQALIGRFTLVNRNLAADLERGFVQGAFTCFHSSEGIDIA